MRIKYTKKLFSSFRKDGLINTVKKVWYTLRPLLFRQCIMYHKDVTLSTPRFRDSLKFVLASEKDIDEEYKDFWNTKSKAIEKLKNGHQLFLLKDSGKNAFYCWVGLRRIDIPWLRIKNLDIPPDVAYLSNAYVPPEFQNRLLGKRFLKFYERYLRDATGMGGRVKKILCITSPGNPTPNRLLRITGYVPYQHIYFIRIFGLNFYLVTSLDEARPKAKKIFIQNAKFWNYFSSVLKNN